jgi:Kef-type K+ transport system membrane component KefB
LIAGGYYRILSGGQVSYFFFSLFVGTALAITAFPMMARIMDERKLLNTKFGSFIMLSASIQDVVSWILLAFVTSMAKHEGLSQGCITLASAFLAVFAAFFVLTPLFKKMGVATEKSGMLSLNHFSIIMITILVSAFATDWLGLYSVFGGFILGLSMPRGTVFQKEINSKLYYFTAAFGLPLFFTFSGLNANLLVLSGMRYFIPCIVILVIAFASKYLSCLFAMRSGGFSWAESSATGGLMNARGLMELIVINIGLTYGIINTEFYSILILVAITTTLSAIPIFKLSLRGKELKFNE